MKKQKREKIQYFGGEKDIGMVYRVVYRVVPLLIKIPHYVMACLDDESELCIMQNITHAETRTPIFEQDLKRTD